MSKKTKELQALTDKLSSQLAESLYNTTSMLQNILDLTERYYENSHSRYVSELSEKVSNIIGLNSEETFKIKLAGLLHDIGKVGFRDSALYKNPKEMTGKEFTQYKLHVNIGREILYNHKELIEIADIIYQHHEQVNGAGFPERLKGDEIHIGAKIISVVDYYHNAMFKNMNPSDASNDISKNVKANDYLNETQRKFNNIVDNINEYKNERFDPNIADIVIKIAEAERKKISGYEVKKIHLFSIKPGMIFAESYYSTSGLLIANKGEIVTDEDIRALYRCAESDQIPMKLLMMSEGE